MPGVATVVIGSLAIGIGVNTTVFSWIQARTLQPMAGVPRSGSYYSVEPRTDAGIYPGVSWLEYRDLRDRLPGFVDLIAFRMAPFSVGDAAWSERTFGMLVSPNYFEALGVTPAAGRFFTPNDAPLAGGEGQPVAVVSYGFWQARLGGSADAPGRTLRVNNRTVTILGVASPEFYGTTMGVGCRPVDSRDARSGAAVRIPGARESRTARLLADRAARSGRFSEHRAARARRRVRRIRAGLSRGQPIHSRRSPAALARAARTAADAHGRARRSASGDVPGAAGGLRQHRESAPRAGERAPAGNGRSAGAWRRSFSRIQSGAHREPGARRGRDRPRDPVGHVGHGRDTGRPDADAGRRDVAVRLGREPHHDGVCGGPRIVLGRAFRPDPGAAAFAGESAAVTAVGQQPVRPKPRAGTR